MLMTTHIIKFLFEKKYWCVKICDMLIEFAKVQSRDPELI